MKVEKKPNIILYFLFIILMFVLFEFVSEFIISLFGSSIYHGKYIKEIILESIYLVTIIFVLLLFGNGYVFREKKIGFFKGLSLAIPFLFIAIVNFDPSELLNTSIANSISLLVYTTLIGLAEEFMCRGWIQNEMLERYGNSRGQVIVSIILSALIFGVMHITNILAGQGIVQTVSQIIQATASGFLFGAIYYRSKNIWLVVFLHTFWNFCLMSGNINLLKECTFLNPSLKGSIYSLVASLPLCTVYITTGLYLLRNSKICENFGYQMDKDAKIAEEKNVWKMIFVASGIYILVVSFISPLSKYYNNSFVCYDYDEYNLSNYSLTRNFKDNYVIDYERWEEISEDEDYVENYSFNVYVDDDNKLVIENEIINQSVSLNYNVLGYNVVKNDESYYIGLLTKEKEGSVLYYSNYINEENMNNDSLYLENVRDSFERFVLPDSNNIYTLKVDGNDDEFIAVSNQEGFIFVDNNSQLFIVYN